MRKIVCLWIVLLLLCAACRQNQVRLSGKFENTAKRYLLLSRLEPDDVVFLDTILLLNGNFSHTLTEESVGFYGLKYDDTTFLFFIAQNGDKLFFTGDAQNLKATYDVQGSEETRLLLKTDRKLNLFYEKTKEWDAIPYDDNYEHLLDSLYSQEFNCHKEYLAQFIAQHKGKLVTLLVFYKRIRGNAFFDEQNDRDLLQEIYTALNQNYPNNVYVNDLKNRLEDKY
jgi:hypothetical protein